uniref:Uncharacterized protein n=1 Tax=Kalanchoe fedtschenkoi TaxID=63787 RepID=A0A7N0U531_KALFE
MYFPTTCSGSVTGCLSLEKMAYLRNPFPSMKLADIEDDNCPKLVEIGGFCNLETASDMSASRAKYLGYTNFESFGEKDVSIDPYAPRRLLKGVYRSGLCSVFLLGDHIDKWFTTVTYGSELIYTVPLLPNRSVRAFNVLYVCKCLTYPLVASANLCLKNEGSKWNDRTSQPDILCTMKRRILFVRREVDLTWISHWCVIEHREFRLGDLLNISIISKSYDKVSVKCGIKIVYEDADEMVVESGSCIDVTSSNNGMTMQEETLKEGDCIADWYNTTFRIADLSIFQCSTRPRVYKLVCDADLDCSLSF